MIARTLIILIVLGQASASFADALFPLSSLREQVGNNCWAYGAAHILEARLEHRDGVMAAIDIEKSYYYWQVRDRLYNSYLRKQESAGLTSYMGFAADLFYIMGTHGLELFTTSAHPAPPSFEYPSSFRALLESADYSNDLRSNSAVISLERQLVSSSMSDVEARRLIDETLKENYRFRTPMSPETAWVDGTKMPVTETLSKMRGTDAASYDPSDFVFVSGSVIQKNPELNGRWIKYDDDRFAGVGESDPARVLALARASLDRGWPLTLETKNHVVAALGYRAVTEHGKTKRVYAVANSSGAYFPRGFSWQDEEDLLDVIVDATAFYPAVADLLPAPPVKKLRAFRQSADFVSVVIDPK